MFNLKLLFFVPIFLLIWMLLGLNPYYSRMIEVKIQSNRDYIAQVFWRNDPYENFSESNSVTIKIDKDVQVKRYLFNIPSTTFLDSIRLDPLNTVGNLKIIEVNLIVKTIFGQTQVHPVDFSRIYDVQNLRMEINGGELAITSTSDDPMLFLNIKYKNSNSSFINKYPERKFYFLCFLALIGVALAISKEIKFSLVTSIVILIFSILFSNLIVHGVNHFNFNIQSVNDAIGHMNYNGLSKSKDQSILFLNIILTPIIFFCAVRLLRKMKIVS